MIYNIYKGDISFKQIKPVYHKMNLYFNGNTYTFTPNYNNQIINSSLKMTRHFFKKAKRLNSKSYIRYKIENSSSDRL